MYLRFFCNPLKSMTGWYVHNMNIYVHLSLPPVNLIDIMNKTAVPLDPTYTLKGVLGLLGELRANPTSFSGKRILYIHTGQSAKKVIVLGYYLAWPDLDI